MLQETDLIRIAVLEWKEKGNPTGLRFTASRCRRSELPKYPVNLVKWVDSIQEANKLAEKLNRLDPQPPNKNYHVFHVCFCSRCGDGQIFSHSQGSWDAHLKTVDNSQIVDLLIGD